MDSRKHSLLSLAFTVLMAVPIFLIIQMGKSVNDQNWETLQLASVNYLIGIWVCWVFTVSIAIYYKWTEKSDFFFRFNYAYLIVAFVIFAHYNDQLFLNLDISGESYGKNMLNAIRTIKNAVPILGATLYLQASVWWFEKKWHRP